MNLNKLKIIGVFTLVFALTVTLAACDMNGNGNGNDAGNGNDEDFVWATFTNNYFTFDYPGPWEDEDGDFVVLVADSLKESEANQAFMAIDMSQELPEDYESHFWQTAEETGEVPEGFEEEFMESFIDSYGEDIEFDELEVDEFNGYISIEGVGTTKEEDELKISLVLFYYQEANSILISYMAPEEYYDDEIRERIYSSFEVNIETEDEDEDNDFLTFTNSPYYEIDYPSNWEVQEDGAPEIVLFGKEEIGFNPNVNIFIEENVYMTDEEYKNLNLEVYEAWENFTLLKDTQTSVDGYTAYEITFSHTEFDYPLTQNQIFIVKDGDAYTLTYTNEEDKFDDHKNTFDIMVDTFQFY